MRKFKVISLGNIPTSDGDFEVNDAHHTGKEIELKDVSLSSIMKQLKAVGELASHVTRRSLYIDEASSNENCIFIRGKRRGHWLWELRRFIDVAHSI